MNKTKLGNTIWSKIEGIKITDKFACCESLHYPKRVNDTVNFTIAITELNITKELALKYLGILQKEIGLEFEYKEESYGIDFELDYTKYSCPFYGYLIFILIRLVYNVNGRTQAGDKVVNQMFELKEKTKYQWFKCLQLAHSFRNLQGSVDYLYGGKFPRFLLNKEEFSKYLVGEVSLFSFTQSNTALDSRASTLKDLIKVVKDNDLRNKPLIFGEFSEDLIKEINSNLKEFKLKLSNNQDNRTKKLGQHFIYLENNGHHLKGNVGEFDTQGSTVSNTGRALKQYPGCLNWGSTSYNIIYYPKRCLLINVKEI